MLRQYEGMFLFDAAAVGDLAAAKAEIQRIMQRAGAHTIVCRKWDDRRTAYEIGPCKRGLYLLAYFRVETEKVRDIEHDIHLSEKIVRAIVLRVEGLTEERMHEILPEKLDTMTTPREAPAERSERSDRGGDYEREEYRVDELPDVVTALE